MPGLPHWILPQAELRRRICKLLDERDTNGWTPTLLGEAMELSDPSADVCGKAQRGKWIGPNEQLRMCRVVHLIETGRLTTTEVLANRGHWITARKVAIRVEPEAPARPTTAFRASVGRRGVRLQMSRTRQASHSELYLEDAHEAVRSEQQPHPNDRLQRGRTRS